MSNGEQWEKYRAGAEKRFGERAQLMGGVAGFYDPRVEAQRAIVGETPLEATSRERAAALIGGRLKPSIAAPATSAYELARGEAGETVSRLGGQLAPSGRYEQGLMARGLVAEKGLHEQAREAAARRLLGGREQEMRRQALLAQLMNRLASGALSAEERERLKEVAAVHGALNIGGAVMAPFTGGASIPFAQGIGSLAQATQPQGYESIYG